MRKEEVPQDPGFLEEHKRGAYAVGDDGKYGVVATSGWQAETAATEVALKVADAEIAAAWQLVHEGRKSPLHYQLAARQLSAALVAEYAGTSRLTVWWHCRPGPFASLSPQWKERYAKALRITVERLVTLPAQPESWQ